MSAEDKDKSKFKDKLKQTYRFIIRNDEDLRELNSFKLSLSKIYFLIISFLLFLCFLIVSLIFFTPIKRLIPGFGDIENNMVFVNLNREILELEKQLDEQITYTTSLKKIVFEGSDVTAISNTSQGSEIQLDTDHDHSHNHSHNMNNIVPLFCKPVDGNVSLGYMLKKDHFGIDLVCQLNSEVKSITKGVVINAGWNPNTGNTISIQHPDNMISIYKHNASLLKGVGDFVMTGEAIAIVGNSGEQSSGPHLHFEMWYEGEHVDPELFINFDNNNGYDEK